MEKYIKKKSRRYTGVYSRQLLNGDISYYITYTDAAKKFRTIKIGTRSGGITEKYCFNKRNEIISRIRLGEDPFAHLKKSTIVTLDMIASEYFAFLKREGNSNADKEHRRYNNHIKQSLGGKDISLITPDDINNIKFKKIKTLAPKTVDHILDLVGVIFNHAIKCDRYKGVNPVNSILVKRYKVDNTRERFLTKEEVDELLKAIENEPILNLFVRFSLSLGGRLNSILDIQRKDIQERRVLLKDHKNNSTFAGRLSTHLLPDLTFLETLSPNDYVIGFNGQRISDKYIQSHLSKVLNDLFNQGLDKSDRKHRVVVHTLRHTFASNLAINGVPIFTIKKLINHKDIRMTMRYAKLSPENGFDEVDNLYRHT